MVSDQFLFFGHPLQVSTPIISGKTKFAASSVLPVPV
jgi:hypothetical protein